MESLSYIFWVFCLVQIATVNGKPEFGTSFQFSLTPTISQLSSEISSLFASMDDELHFMMSSLIPNSENQRLVLASFAEDFGVSARSVTDLMDDSSSSTSSMDTTLGMVLSAYAQLVDYFNSNANNFLQSTNREIGSYVTREFFSGLVRLVTSLPAFRSAVEQLQNRLQTATTPADVPSDVVHALVRALQQLKAHLPLLVFSFQRVGVNFRLADTFITLFKQDLQTLTSDFVQEAQTFTAELSTFETAVGTMFEFVEQLYSNAGTQLDEANFESQNNFMQLRGVLKSFVTDRLAFLQDLIESVQLASTGNRQAVENDVSNVYYVDGSYSLESLGLQLVSRLITSGVYDVLCYSKYSALVADLPTLGRIRLNECFHTELPRLRKLQVMVQTYTQMVSYDVEDLWHNVKPCHSQFAANTCLLAITGRYNELFTARNTASATRPGNFLKSALTASLNRIGLCFAKTNFLTYRKLVPSLEQGIRSC